MMRFMMCMMVLVAATGCQPPELNMEMFAPPELAPELARLDPLIGSWVGTAEMVSPTAEEMNAMMAEGEPTIPSTFHGSNANTWALEGRFLKGEGWHEMPDGKRAHYVEYWTWDPLGKKYRSWYFGNYGDFGTGTARFTDDGKTMKMKFKGVDHQGKRMSGHSTMTFTDTNQLDWTWTQGGLFHKMKMKGTSHRQP